MKVPDFNPIARESAYRVWKLSSKFACKCNVYRYNLVVGMLTRWGSAR
jgi:hypothetical protein